MLRIIRNAESEANLLEHKFIMPVHLLIGSLREPTGALGEISLKLNFDLLDLREKARQIDTIDLSTTSLVYFNLNVTTEVAKVIEVTISYTKKYNQIYVNEGHLLKALITTNVVDTFLTTENIKTILSLGTTSRDMITHLGNYTFPDIDTHLIRKVTKSDSQGLIRFVETNFSYEWSQTIKEAFKIDEPPIYIALNKEGDIIGFSTFDVYQNKKCYFGPMGVTVSNRIKGIGYSLLHYCLRDMKQIGYEYAIIGGAGPQEFYEKACNAVVIPSN
jgi:N-acetylglutamate synthase-like GNAT family acetyltransferase